MYLVEIVSLDEGREVDEAGRDPPAKPSERALVCNLNDFEEPGAKTQCTLPASSSLEPLRTAGEFTMRDHLRMSYLSPRKRHETNRV